MKILVADLGGSNCRFALADTDNLSLKLWLESGQAELFETLSLPTSDFASTADLLSCFREIHGKDWMEDCATVVLAVAGPIHGDGIFAPNMGEAGWFFSKSDCSGILGIEDIYLINDFVAQALACQYNFAVQPEVICEGIAYEAYPRRHAVVGAGTGLGMCLLVSDVKGGVDWVPSEGGHTGFFFEHPEERAFMEFACQAFGVEVLTGDLVLGGQGLTVLHEFVHGEKLSAAEVAGQFSEQSKVLGMYAGFYGRACRNYVLYTTAWGGLYITGGIALKNPEIFQHSSFLESFHGCVTYGDYLQRVPIYRYTRDDAGLWGALAYAAFMLD